MKTYATLLFILLSVCSTNSFAGQGVEGGGGMNASELISRILYKITSDECSSMQRDELYEFCIRDSKLLTGERIEKCQKILSECNSI